MEADTYFSFDQQERIGRALDAGNIEYANRLCVQFAKENAGGAMSEDRIPSETSRMKLEFGNPDHIKLRDDAVRQEAQRDLDEHNCPGCGEGIDPLDYEKGWEGAFDPFATGETTTCRKTDECEECGCPFDVKVWLWFVNVEDYDVTEVKFIATDKTARVLLNVEAFCKKR